MNFRKFILFFLALEILLAHGNMALAQADITKPRVYNSGVADQIRKYLCAPTEDNYGQDPSFFEVGKGTGSGTGAFSGEKSETLSYESGLRNQAKYDLYRCINQMYKFAIVLASVIAVLFIVIAGYLYMSAEGNKESVDKAKDILVTSITALVILFIGYILLRAINPDLVTFQSIQPPSVQVKSASVPSVTFNTNGTVASVKGGAGHTWTELQGCDFQQQKQKDEVANMTQALFDKVKAICYNIGVKDGSKGKPQISSVIGEGQHSENSFHYRGCAVDFAGGNDNFVNTSLGKALIAEGGALGMRVNPGTDANQTFHVHLDLGSSCPSAAASQNITPSTSYVCPAAACSQYASQIASASTKFSLPAGLDKAKIISTIMYHESACQVGVSSAAQSCGLMQLKPSTANTFKAACGAASETITCDWLKSPANVEKSICMAGQLLQYLSSDQRCGSSLSNILVGYAGGEGVCKGSSPITQESKKAVSEFLACIQ